MKLTTKFKIFDEDSKTYFSGMTAIGPCFGATKTEALVFDSVNEALAATKGRNWILVSYKIVESRS